MFKYFNEEWNEKEKIGGGCTDIPGVAGSVKDSDSGPKQEEVPKKNQTQK